VKDRPEPRPTLHHDAGPETDFAEGRLETRVIEGREVGIARVEGRLHAVQLRCTHAAWLMDDAPLQGFEIACSLHGARFDLRDGCPTRGPASRPLAHYPIRVRAGRVEIEMPARRGSARQSGSDRC
jgi:3-phenylpropionate/trans-cinnamate dioxygenase ferredoxin subunit